MKSQPSKIVSSFYKTGKTEQEKVSRYSFLKRLVNEDGEVYLESPNKVRIKETNRDSFFTVTKGYEYRIDLISNRFYGTPLLYWAICYMNNIYDPFDVKAGIVLRIPTIQSIYETGVIDRV